MTTLLSDLVHRSAEQRPGATALVYKSISLTYQEFTDRMARAASGFLRHGLGRGERVGVYLEKRPETLAALFGAASAGGTFVPINPVLRPHQVQHIVADCNVRILVTSPSRWAMLAAAKADLPDLRLIVTVDAEDKRSLPTTVPMLPWTELLDDDAPAPAPHRVLDTDMAAILYTSGSTGLPKGVVLSHRNLSVGAESVCQYLELVAEDRILSVLPLSFDYGLNQFVSAFNVGATVVIMDYLVPADVIRWIEKERITGLGCVPPLWTQLAALDWPSSAASSLRYITNSGGAMPRATLAKLRAKLPDTRVYLMYGLTEAFRSTYLAPEEVDKRPDSIGRAIPHAEVMVVRADGTLCTPGEPGELVHRGPLVSMGYWNDPLRTAERFRPAPTQPREISLTEMAVWSGDTVRMDEDGFLYFVGRSDDMIKTSGYRVSPTEVEDVIHATGLVGEAVAFGVPHPVLGQGIVVAVTAGRTGPAPDGQALRDACRKVLPAYMVPQTVVTRTMLPHNPNGKLDRRSLFEEYRDLFALPEQEGSHHDG